jgi:hypothetical protein
LLPKSIREYREYRGQESTREYRGQEKVANIIQECIPPSPCITFPLCIPTLYSHSVFPLCIISHIPHLGTPRLPGRPDRPLPQLIGPPAGLHWPPGRSSPLSVHRPVFPRPTEGCNEQERSSTPLSFFSLVLLYSLSLKEMSRPPSRPFRGTPTVTSPRNYQMAKQPTTAQQLQALMSMVSTLTATVQSQQERIEALQTPKKSKAKKEALGRPEGFPPEPSSFKVPNGGPFGLFVPDGWLGVDRGAPPPIDQAIQVNRRSRDLEMGVDGLYPVVETRHYIAGNRGWKRAKKDNGWCTYFPSRVETAVDETAVDETAHEFDAAIRSLYHL